MMFDELVKSKRWVHRFREDDVVKCRLSFLLRVRVWLKRWTKESTSRKRGGLIKNSIPGPWNGRVRCGQYKINMWDAQGGGTPEKMDAWRGRECSLPYSGREVENGLGLGVVDHAEISGAGLTCVLLGNWFLWYHPRQRNIVDACLCDTYVERS